MALIFRYIHVEREDGTLQKAPYIPIYASTHKRRLLRIPALLDSGADSTVIPKDLAKELGLKEEPNSGDETKGIGGKVKTKRSKIQFKVRNEHENYSLSIPVLILQNNSANVPLILGRQGFFENFDITFRQHSEKILLKKIKK